MYPFSVNVEHVLSVAYGLEFARQRERLERLLLMGFGGVLSKMRRLLVKPHNEARVVLMGSQAKCNARY